mmetsp:Transcript_61162/g.175466  ORF Transcript_61162/g.175466 Transcript_61162/m.175466 type:complete len:217 (+) Transcript_61162:775-1425(+)
MADPATTLSASEFCWFAAVADAFAHCWDTACGHDGSCGFRFLFCRGGSSTLDMSCVWDAWLMSAGLPDTEPRVCVRACDPCDSSRIAFALERKAAITARQCFTEEEVGREAWVASAGPVGCDNGASNAINSWDVLMVATPASVGSSASTSDPHLSCSRSCARAAIFFCVPFSCPVAESAAAAHPSRVSSSAEPRLPPGPSMQDVATPLQGASAATS